MATALRAKTPTSQAKDAKGEGREKPSVLAHTCNPRLEKLSQEGQELKASMESVSLPLQGAHYLLTVLPGKHAFTTRLF